MEIVTVLLGRPLLAGVTAMVITAFLSPVVRLLAVRGGWVTRPVEDRWGHRVVARLGGIAMFAGFVTAILLWVPWSASIRGLLVGVTAVFGLGLVDDVRRLPPYTKLVAQLLIGCIVVLSGIHIELIGWPWLSIPLSVLWFILVMNAFNLLDNMDGLAAGVGALAGAFCALHAALAGHPTTMLLGAILAGTCVGFLRFNFPPAKIFMGDSGSHLLGLSLAMLALMGSWRHSTQLISVLAVPVLVLAVPIFDTCFVTIQRLVHHQHPFVGGQDHISHRLAILGLSPRQTVLALYAVSGCLGVLSVFSAQLQAWSAVVTWLFALTGLLLIGAYLGKVNVYRVEPTPETPQRFPHDAVTFIETMLLHKRRILEVLVDFCLVSGAYVFAHLLRFEGVLSADLQRLVVQSLPVILVVKIGCFTVFGMYQGMWRYLGLSDVLRVFKAVTIGSVVSALALLYLWRFEGYSRAVVFIDWMLTFLSVGSARVVERLLDEWLVNVRVPGIPVLIIGAGDTGERVLRYLRFESPDRRRVVGFLDDDVRKVGNDIHGIPVLGARDQLPQLLEGSGIQEVLVAISDPPGELLRWVQECCEPRGVSWKVVAAGVTNVV